MISKYARVEITIFLEIDLLQNLHKKIFNASQSKNETIKLALHFGYLNEEKYEIRKKDVIHFIDVDLTNM